jgi:hypothetical protein
MFGGWSGDGTIPARVPIGVLGRARQRSTTPPRHATPPTPTTTTTTAVVYTSPPAPAAMAPVGRQFTCTLLSLPQLTAPDRAEREARRQQRIRGAG